MKASAIILINKNKQILLQLRSSDAIHYPRKWGFFGGGIEKGETPKECVIRECLEELNYKLENPKLIFKKRVNFILTQHVFIEEYNPSKKLILMEGKNMGWFKLSEIDKLDIIPFVKSISKKVASKINHI